jgi:prevent-host-death family protein
VQIGVRELRARLAGFVRRAEAGESIVITVSGRPAAVLGPVGGRAELTLEDLVALGTVTAPRARTGRPAVTRTRLPVDARSDVELRKVR